MATDGILFKVLKEDRNGYFVEYHPPQPGDPFAVVQLVFYEPADVELVAQKMECEATHWITRYRIAVMVAAFNEAGDLIDLVPTRACTTLLALCQDGNRGPQFVWASLPDSAFPRQPLDSDYLKRLFHDIPFTTAQERQEQVLKEARGIRAGFAVIFIWSVIVPAAVAILGAASVWFGRIVLVYSLWRATKKGLQMRGRWPKSKRDRERVEEERRMRHHHYHCERNPEGFQRLKMENFEAEEREQIRREALALKGQGVRQARG